MGFVPNTTKGKTMAAGVDLGGLWKKQTKQGEEYWEGPFGRNAVIRIYSNRYKQKDNQPDYKIYISPKLDQDRQARPQYQTQQAQGAYQQPQPVPQPTPGPRLPPHKRPGYVPPEPPQDETPWPDEPPF